MKKQWINETHLVDRAKPTMTELIELGEEISGDLENPEFEEQVEIVASVGSIFFVAAGAAVTLQPPLQAGTKKRKQTHGSINDATFFETVKVP